MTDTATITWTPNPAEPLLDVMDTTAPVAVQVSVTSDDPQTDPEITGYQVEPPLPPQVDVSISGNTLDLIAPHWSGTFSPVAIEFLREGQLQIAPDWDALPADAEELIAFFASATAVIEYQLSITSTEGAEIYTVRLTHDYTTGRDRLKEEVDARR